MRLFALKVPDTVPEETLDRLLHHLPEAAQDRVRRFRHEADAILAGRLLPTWYLRTSSLLPPGAHPTFATGERGKPFLADPHVAGGLDFNTSHEGAYVLLAVVAGEDSKGVIPQVGVDVMDLPSDADALARDIQYQLTRDERLAIAGARGRVKAKLVTTLWTVKEGYTKATGTGVAFGLERIDVDPGDGGVAGVRVDGEDIRDHGWTWAVGSLDAGAYGYAVIWRGDRDGAVRPQVEHVAWDSFVRAFIGQPATPP